MLQLCFYRDWGGEAKRERVHLEEPGMKYNLFNRVGPSPPLLQKLYDKVLYKQTTVLSCDERGSPLPETSARQKMSPEPDSAADSLPS